MECPIQPQNDPFERWPHELAEDSMVKAVGPPSQQVVLPSGAVLKVPRTHARVRSGRVAQHDLWSQLYLTGGARWAPVDFEWVGMLVETAERAGKFIIRPAEYF